MIVEFLLPNNDKSYILLSLKLKIPLHEGKNLFALLLKESFLIPARSECL